MSRRTCARLGLQGGSKDTVRVSRQRRNSCFLSDPKASLPPAGPCSSFSPSEWEVVAFALPRCVCFVWNQAEGRSLPQGRGWEGMCGGVCKARQEAPLSAGRPGTQEAQAERGEVGTQGALDRGRGQVAGGGTLEHPAPRPAPPALLPQFRGLRSPPQSAAGPPPCPSSALLLRPHPNTPILTRVFLSCLSSVPVPSPLLPASRLWSP